MALLTPRYNLHDYPDVYEPCEDTHLFLDALEKDRDYLVNLKPILSCEIGCGSGVLMTALATILKNTCAYFCTDINIRACAATKKTSTMNGVDLETIGMNLTTFLRCQFDIILFNPPYVITRRKEIAGSGLNRAYAGGRNGREIIDNFLKTLPEVLMKNGVCYMLLLKENNIEEIEEYLGKFGFHSEIVIERRIPGEYLYVYKFFR